MTTFRISVPADFVLARDVCSYGYFLLEPNHWDPGGMVFRTTVDLDGKAVTVRMTQGGAREERKHSYTSLKRLAGEPLVVRADAGLSAEEKKVARGAIARMLHLNETRERIGEFHRLDKRFKRSGAGG